MTSTPAESLPFDTSEFLDSRVRDQERVVVELGHRAEPIVCQNLEYFEGSRIYIGIEANLRNPYGKFSRSIDRFYAAHRDKKIVFLNQDVGAVPIREEGVNSTDLEGNYYPETILPAGAADEVIVGNVFGDPHIAYDKTRTEALISELGRLISSDGIIVVRETISPRRVRYVTQKALIECGLKMFGKIQKASEADSRGGKLWWQLEVIYGTTDQKYSSNDSYYMFLGSSTSVR